MCWSSYHHHRFDRSLEDRRRLARPSATDRVSAPENIRVSDAERHRVIEVLKQHTAEGRLTLDEFEVRVDEALSARTGTDLRTVLRDLPALETEGPRPRAHRSLTAPLLRLPVAAMALILVWLVAGHLVLWPLFVVAFFWFPVCARWHRYAGAEHETVSHTDSDDVTTFV